MRNNPTNEDEALELVKDIARLLATLNHDSAAFDATVKEACAFAGCFNHNIKHEHRKMLVEAIGINGEDAIRPVLHALLECSREEQVDITVAIITELMTNYDS